MTRHIVFSMSAAGSLREALRLAEKPGTAMGLGDDLSFGPIDDVNTAARLAFIDEVLNYDFSDEAEAMDDFWAYALDVRQPRIVWLSRWSAQEYCGFLEWLSRNGDAAFQLIDLSDVIIPVPNAPYRQVPVHSTAALTHGEINDNALWDLAKTPPAALLHAWGLLWRKLRADNAPLRVLTATGLQSAGLDYFDADLMKHVGRRFVPAGAVVGRTLGEMDDDRVRKGGVRQCGDTLLFSRVRTLVEEGVLEAQGDIYEPGFEVRRRQNV